MIHTRARQISAIWHCSVDQVSLYQSAKHVRVAWPAPVTLPARLPTLTCAHTPPPPCASPQRAVRGTCLLVWVEQESGASLFSPLPLPPARAAEMLLGMPPVRRKVCCAVRTGCAGEGRCAVLPAQGPVL